MRPLILLTFLAELGKLGYIPARLADNPDLSRTDYASVLAGLPEELRRAYRDGNFSAAMRDDDF